MVAKRVMTNQAGVDLSAVYAAISATTPEIPALPRNPGDQVIAEDGSIWTFGTAGGTIVTNDAVAYDASWVDVQAILGSAASAHRHRGFAFCQNAGMSSGESGWFLTHGAPTIRILDTAAVDVPLYTTAQAGVLSTTAATGSQFPIKGLYLISAVTSATASVQNANAIAQFPHIGYEHETPPA